LKPNKLLIVNHAVEMGGAEKVLLRFLDAIDKNLFEPELACPHNGPLAAEMRARNIPVHFGYPSSRLLEIKRQSLGSGRWQKMAYPYDMCSTVFKLARFIRRGGYDLILTNSAKADIYGSLAGRLAGRPVVWRLHDIITTEAFNRLNMMLFRLCASLFATRVLAVSNAVRAALIDLGVPGRKVSVVYNGIEPRAVDMRERSGMRGRLGVADQAPLAGLVGRLVDWKGPDLFIEAAARVREKMSEARFILVGDAIFGEKSYTEELEGMAKRLGLEEAAVFTGFRDDVDEIMACLDVLVHASILPDPLPTVLIEAMSCGLAVIASDGGGVREIVEDGVTGIIVPPKDVQAMAAAMFELLADKEEARRMGEMGRKRAAGLFDLEKTAAEMQTILLECLEEKNGKRWGCGKDSVA
jgi:glycosyltransferase involved in cell wall biosynthesis